MGVDELTQKFKLKGEICPKSDTSKRWRILDAYPTSCYIKEVGGDDFKINDWRALNAWIHLKKSSARGEVLRKLVYEYTSEDFFNIEAADYKRDESKYQKRIFSQTDDESKHKDGDYVVNIEPSSEKENDN